MTEFLQVYLPICVYILLIILLVIGIILGVRLIGAMDKIDALIENVEGKVNSLNGLFSVIDFTSNKISSFTTRTMDLVSGLISRFTGRKTSKEEYDEEDDYE